MNQPVEGNDICFMKTISKELIQQLQATEVECIQKEIELLRLKTFREITGLAAILTFIVAYFC